MTGASRADEKRWRGRVYRRRWSFEPPYGDELALAGERLLWFYPMRESRLVFRASARALVRALTAETQWLIGQLEHVDPSARAELSRALERGAQALRDAARELEERAT